MLRNINKKLRIFYVLFIIIYRIVNTKELVKFIYTKIFCDIILIVELVQ